MLARRASLHGLSFLRHQYINQLTVPSVYLAISIFSFLTRRLAFVQRSPGLSLEFRPFHLGPTPSPGHRYDPTRAAPQAPPTDTSITEDVEVPDFLCVAIPYDALFPQLLDPIPWTQCMGAPAPSPVSPYMARVPNACRDWEEIAPSGSFLAPHVSCFKPARRGSSLLPVDTTRRLVLDSTRLWCAVGQS